MLLAYLDESYDDQRYWIAALVCDGACMAGLGPALDEVVRRAASAYGTSTTAELHGHALFHGKDDWADLQLMHRARIGIYTEAFEALAAYPVQVVIRGVNIPRLRARYAYPDHPHAVVLAHLLERVDDIAVAASDYVLAIADQVEGEEDYRQRLWRFQREPVRGYARRLTRVVDTIHFAPSKSSRFVQGADLIVYLYARMRSGLERDARAERANDKLLKIISDKIHAQTGLWVP